MSERALPLRADAHRVVDAMLPWYVNGTLDDDERALVQHHLDECPRCRDEVEWLRELHAACVACAEQEGPSGALGGLRQRLARRAASDPPRRGGWRTLPTLWRAVAVAQLGVIVALGAMVVSSEDAARYRTLGSSRDGAIARGNAVVVFDATATEAQVRTLLRSVDARVVDGPTQSNAWVLAIPAAQQARALERLRASPGVALAQTLSAEGAR